MRQWRVSESRPGAGRAVSREPRAEYLLESDWPFRPALEVRPSSNGHRTVFSISLTVPPGARLRTGVAIHPSEWDRFPSTWVRFGVEVTVGSGREPLYSRTLEPYARMSDRGWVEVEVPLDAYAGESAVLHFSTEAGDPLNAQLGIAGWDLPRLVSNGR